MNVHTSAFALLNSGPEETSLPAEALHLRWEALHDAAAKVGTMAQLAREGPSARISEFALQFAAMDAGKQSLALNALTDLELILKPGIDALRSLEMRGEDVTAPALTLWCEFHRARQAILALS